jgi:hypothetical protein
MRRIRLRTVTEISYHTRTFYTPHRQGGGTGCPDGSFRVHICQNLSDSRNTHKLLRNKDGTFAISAFTTIPKQEGMYALHDKQFSIFCLPNRFQSQAGPAITGFFDVSRHMSGKNSRHLASITGTQPAASWLLLTIWPFYKARNASTSSLDHYLSSTIRPRPPDD